MKRKMVLRFFMLLLIFAGVLALIQTVRYGSLTGLVHSDKDFDSEQVLAQSNGSVFGFLLMIFVFILIAGLILRYLQSYHERTLGRVEVKSYRRKLIPLDFS